MSRVYNSCPRGVGLGVYGVRLSPGSGVSGF